MEKTSFKTVDEYINAQDKKLHPVLEKLRTTVKKAVPKSEEMMSYGIPTYKLNGLVIHFAAYENHYALYPGPATIDAFKNQLDGLKLSKGTIQFPIDKRVPVKLVAAIAKFNAEKNQEKKGKNK